jgi:transcriptional regulator with XRE-family HTH domain
MYKNNSLTFYSPKYIQTKLAKKVAEVRKQQKYTQAEMAKRSDIPLSTYTRFEQSGELSLKNFSKILAVLQRGHEIENLLNSETEELTPMEMLRRDREKYHAK